MRPAAIFALLLALLIAQPAAAQPYMRDPARVTDVITDYQVLIGLITEERRSQAVPNDFAQHQLRDLPGARQYALSRADDTGQGARIRRDANARTAAILNARQFPAWMTGYPSPARVVDDIRRELAGQEEQGFVSGGRIMGRLTLLRETLRRQAQEQGGPMSPAAMRLFILYEIYQSDISHRLSNDLIIERNCSFFWGVFNLCDHQQYLSNANAYLNSVEETKELYFPIERRYLFTQAAAKAPIEIRHPRTLPPWYWYAGLVAAIGIPLLIILLFAFRWKGVAWLKKVFDWLASFFEPASPVRPTTTNYGSAHFAPDLTSMPPNAPMLGVFFGKQTQEGQSPKAPGAPLFSKPESHTLIVAASGTGKGTSVIIPTLLRYAPSMVVIDPKGENAAVTARIRQNYGHKVFILNPWGEIAEDLKERGFSAARFNPLDVIVRGDPDAVSVAHAMAEAMCSLSDNPTGGSKFFEGSAASILTGVLLWLADQPGETKTLARARSIVTKPISELQRDFFPKMAASSAYDGAIAETIGPFAGDSGKEFPSIRQTLAEATRFISDPRLKAATEVSDFDLGDLTRDLMTLYIIIPIEQMKAQAPWLKLMMSAVAGACRQNKNRTGRCMILIDELVQLGRLPDLTKDLASMRGFGVDYTLVVQNLGQLEGLYGEAGSQTILANCGYKWFCNVVDPKGAETLSRILGDKTIGTKQTSESATSSDRTASTSSSTSYGEMGRRLRTPDEITSLGKGTAFLFAPESPPYLVRPVDYKTIPTEFAWATDHIFQEYFKFPWEYDENPYHRTKQQSAPPPPASSSTMTRERALKRLGLKDGASDQEIRAAYKTMMSKLHPDVGGNDEFAQLLNEARDFLLRRA